MEKSKLDFLKQQYAFDQWRNRNTLTENLLVWKFVPSENEFSNWQPRRIQRVELPKREDSKVSTTIQSIWQAKSGGPDALLRVDSFECRSRAEAHEQLLQTLGEFQSNLLLKRQEIAGDIAFTMPGETTVLFARANLVLWLRNAGPKVQPLGNFASQVDGVLISKPSMEGQMGVTKIQPLDFSNQALSAGAVIALDEGVIETEGQLLWYKFFSASGEMRLEQTRPVYLPSPTGPNQVTRFIIQPKPFSRDQSGMILLR